MTDAGQRPSIGQLVRYFLYLGSLGFGGPVALVGYMQRDLVERRRWFTKDEYVKSLALSQLAPGPLAAQVAICLGPQCSFDAFVERYDLGDPALAALAAIVRGADTDDRSLTPESAGLYAAATGFRGMSRDDSDNMRHQFPMYDALYAYCRGQTTTGARSPRVLFVCLHGAAKSVVAAAHLRRLAAARGLEVEAVAAGKEPDTALAPAAVQGLAAEGLPARPARPRPVTLYDPGAATRIVTFGCAVDAGTVPVERWDDVPAVSDGYGAARDRIVARLEHLIGDLAAR